MKIQESGEPMMARHEYEYIRDLINDRQLKRCLEWGSGNSTLYFTNNCSVDAWISIEHNGNYIEYINKKHVNKAVSLLWLPESEWYYQCVEKSINTFDFILIDGLFRKECLELAKSIVSKDGVIVLHDSGREEYQVWIKDFNGEKIFDGEKQLPSGWFAHRGITIFRK